MILARMSEKNKLQEYCHKYKLDPPEYESSDNKNPRQPEWFSKVTVVVNGKRVTTDIVGPCLSKVSAEKQAAQLMLDYIYGSSSPESETRLNSTGSSSPHKLASNDPLADQFKNLCAAPKPSEITNIYLIDLENKPCFKYVKFQSNCLYIGFINSIHNSVGQYIDWHQCKSDDIAAELAVSNNPRLLYLIEGGTPDLADHFMTALIYPIVDYLQKNDIKTTVSIISGDHAGWCTRSCLEKVLKWRKMTSIEIANGASLP